MLKDFTYWTPTKVVFGPQAETQAGTLIKQFGGTKVLIHYGSERVRKSGLLGRIETTLKQEGLSFVSLGGVVPNPRLSLVHEGIALGKEEQIDFILAVGGGSVIDSAKAIGYGLYHGGEVWDFYSRKRPIEGCLPVGSVLTLAAAGSEMSDSSVITNEDGNLKRGVSSDYCRCRFAIMNPTLTFTLPHYQTMCGATDIMMHTMERYFQGGPSLPLTDALSEALMQSVRRDAYILDDHPDDYAAREDIMWASSLSHNGLTNTGNSSRGDWASHQLEHEVGGMFDVAHGAGLAALWGSWARYVFTDNPERFARFGRKVFDLASSGNTEKDALAAIEAVMAFYGDIGMPRNFKELGIKASPEQIEEMAKKCTFFGKRTIGDFRILGKEDIVAIYTMANEEGR